VPDRKAFSIYLFSIFLLAFSNAALADWFLSSETKELIAKADAGDAEAQFRVGSAYDTGKGAPRSRENAMRYYLIAAEQGHAEAQNSVGSGLQAEKRYAEALVWYERAAAQGHALATNNLALLYDLGLGVKQDRHKGFELYSKAADLGWAESMWNIANMYGAGQLGEIDMVSACVWTMRARRYANPNDQRLQAHLTQIMPYLERTLSSNDMAKCKQKADEWVPKHNAQQVVPGDAPQAALP
jgi:uncharacterized protein